jgi:hypothetical protein
MEVKYGEKTMLIMGLPFHLACLPKFKKLPRQYASSEDEDAPVFGCYIQDSHRKFLLLCSSKW